MIVTKENHAECPHCHKPMRQDPDTLDTWFSSALWPFSTLGWPEETEDLKRFYPTSTLVTGYDIITFWVSRMIFSGLEYMGEKPFHDVLIHGLVRDAKGRKMSKSLGNGIDPLLIIDQYGADALRFALASNNSPGNDMRFSDERIESARNFANKIWNAARYILMNLKVKTVSDPATLSGLAIEDKWVLTKFNRVCREVSENLDRYELGVALAKLYDFIWDVFCDWYIELVKPRLFDEDCPTRDAAQNTLAFVFTSTLKLLHPFMPFITEEIWQKFPHEGESIMISAWPEAREDLNFPAEEESLEKIIAVIVAIRNRRNEMNVPASKKVPIYIETEAQKDFEESTAFLMRLAGAGEVHFDRDFDPEKSVAIATDAASVFIPLLELLDPVAEKARLENEKEKTLCEIERIVAKLSNEQFVSKAPEKVVNDEKDKLKAYQNALENILSTYQKLFS